MPRAHRCQHEDCPCVQCSVCSKKYMGKHKLAHHQRHTACWLKLTQEQSEADQAGRKVGQVAEVASEEEVKVVVREPQEEEEQLGLEEEETMGGRSELLEEGGEQEEMVEVEVVMGRQSEKEERMLFDAEEQVEEERLSEDEEHWGQDEVVVVTLAKPVEVEEQGEQVDVEEQVVFGELNDEELGGEQEVLGEVEVVVGEQESPATGKPQSKITE